jgi:REP element-mobilizing transposase RayT
MAGPPRLQMGLYYHIFNRGTNGENIFREERNYHFFLQRYAKYIEPVAYTYAYCLLKNHFHFLVRIKTEEEQKRDFETLNETLKVSKTFRVFRVLEPSQQFSNFFNAYAKAFNKTYGRTGSLFEHPFGRIEVDSDAYFLQLIAYIHQNPQKHGFVGDFRDWPFSSYHTLLSTKQTRLQREEVLDWFGGPKEFEVYHQTTVDASRIVAYLPEDPDF